MSDAFERCCEHLRSNGVGLGATPPILGSWVTLDPEKERFVQEFADEANRLSRRQYRRPFVVPEVGWMNR